MTKHDLNKNLLFEDPNLEAITNPFQRFYKYKEMTSFKDRDRCATAQEVYKILNWYNDKNDDKNMLEPDTFFSSSHNLIRQLFREHDKRYYEGDFKRYIEELSYNYDALSDYDCEYYRYLR